MHSIATAMQTPTAAGERTDFFVSYTSADVDWAKWIAWELRQAGFKMALQAWDFVAGQNFILRMNEEAVRAARTIAVMSPSYFASEFTAVEWSAALGTDPRSERSPLVPVRVREVEPAGLWRSITYIDLVGLDHEAARTRLVSDIRAVVEGGAPRTAPAFPGSDLAAHVLFPPVAADERADAAVSEARTALRTEHERRRRRHARRTVGLRLRSPDAVFFDREPARAAVTDLITSPDTGLVLVIGPPGCGKTALASWVLARLEDDDDIDGIAYLSGRTRGLGFERLYSDVATLLGGESSQELLAHSNDDPEARVPELLLQLQDRACVILLDNFEDVLDEAGEIEEPALRSFLEQAVSGGSGVTFVVTSREEPRIASAVLLRTQRVEFEVGLPEGDAVELLRRLDPDGRASLRNAPYEEVARFAAVGWRIPRALEHVVSLRRRGVPLDDFSARADVVRDLAAVAFDELDADSHRAVECLAVLGRAVSTGALSFMLAADRSGLDAQALAYDLARSGLVELDPEQGTVTLHAVDREVALRRMAAEDRIALHRLAAAWWHHLRVPRERRLGLPDLEPHLEEFDQLMLAGDQDAGADVVSDLDSDYRVVGWDARLVADLRQRLEGTLEDPRRRMRHEFGMGQVNLVLGPDQAAIDRFKAALDLACGLGDDRFERACLSWLSTAYRTAGRHEDAAAAAGEAIRRYREAGDVEAEVEWLPSYALACVYAGDVDAAEAAAESALSRAGNEATRAAALDALALTTFTRDRWSESEDYADRSIAIYDSLGNVDGAGYTQIVLGMARFRLGERAGARQALERASAIGAEIGNPRLEGFAAFNLAMVLDAPAARPYAERAHVLLASSGGHAAAAAEALVAALDPAADAGSRQRALAAASAAAGHVPDLLRAL